MDIWIDAHEAYESFINKVSDLHHEEVIGFTAARVATDLSPLFLWGDINEHGAPLYLPHNEACRRVGFSRGTLYSARPELTSTGLIKVVGKTWHAAVGVLHV